SARDPRAAWLSGRNKASETRVSLCVTPDGVRSLGSIPPFRGGLSKFTTLIKSTAPAGGAASLGVGARLAVAKGDARPWEGGRATAAVAAKGGVHGQTRCMRRGGTIGRRSGRRAEPAKHRSGP